MYTKTNTMQYNFVQTCELHSITVYSCYFLVWMDTYIHTYIHITTLFITNDTFTTCIEPLYQRKSQWWCPIPLFLTLFRSFFSKGCVWGDIDNFLKERFWISAHLKDSPAQGLQESLGFALKYSPAKILQRFPCSTAKKSGIKTVKILWNVPFFQIFLRF